MAGATEGLGITQEPNINVNPIDRDISARIEFLLETEKLKSVLRRTSPAHLDRPENSAEHSWSLAIMAILFADLADEALRMEKVLQLVAVHDLVEINAGDTFCYDEAANRDRVLRERAAAEALFGSLPLSESTHFRDLWNEFEAGVTAESRFANALDRLLPLLQHHAHSGVVWKKYGITKRRVLKRIDPIANISTTLHAYAEHLVEESSRFGWLAEV